MKSSRLGFVLHWRVIMLRRVNTNLTTWFDRVFTTF